MGLVRLCTSCNEYIPISESSFGHRKLTLFEKDHDKHPLVTINSIEARGYINFNQKYEALARKKLWFNKIFLIYAILYVTLNVFFLIYDPYKWRVLSLNDSFVVLKMGNYPYQFLIDFTILPLFFGILLYFQAKKRTDIFERKFSEHYEDYLFQFSEFFIRCLFLLIFGIIFLVCATTIYVYGLLLLIHLHLVVSPF